MPPPGRKHRRPPQSRPPQPGPEAPLGALSRLCKDPHPGWEASLGTNPTAVGLTLLGALSQAPPASPPQEQGPRSSRWGSTEAGPDPGSSSGCAWEPPSAPPQRRWKGCCSYSGVREGPALCTWPGAPIPPAPLLHRPRQSAVPQVLHRALPPAEPGRCGGDGGGEPITLLLGPTRTPPPRLLTRLPFGPCGPSTPRTPCWPQGDTISGRAGGGGDQGGSGPLPQHLPEGLGSRGGLWVRANLWVPAEGGNGAGQDTGRAAAPRQSSGAGRSGAARPVQGSWGEPPLRSPALGGWWSCRCCWGSLQEAGEGPWPEGSNPAESKPSLRAENLAKEQPPLASPAQPPPPQAPRQGPKLWRIPERAPRTLLCPQGLPSHARPPSASPAPPPTSRGAPGRGPACPPQPWPHLGGGAAAPPREPPEPASVGWGHLPALRAARGYPLRHRLPAAEEGEGQVGWGLCSQDAPPKNRT